MSNRSRLPPLSPDCARLNAAREVAAIENPDPAWHRLTAETVEEFRADMQCRARKAPATDCSCADTGRGHCPRHCRQPAPVADPPSCARCGKPKDHGIHTIMLGAINCSYRAQPAPVAVPGVTLSDQDVIRGVRAGPPPRASVRFVVPGSPRGKERARSAGKIHYTPKQTRQYEARIRYCYKCVYNGPPWPADVPLRLDVQAYIALPKSATKAEREMCDNGDPVPALVTPDWDNIGKIVSDALNKGIAYADDRQIFDGRVRRWRTTGEERVEVTVEEANA